MSEWQLQNGAFQPLAGGLGSARFAAQSCLHRRANRHRGLVASGLDQRSIRSYAVCGGNRLRRSANTNRLPAGGAIAIDVAPSQCASDADGSLVQAVGFESTVLFDDSQLLELSPTDIDFPAEDSDVLVLARTNSSASAPTEAEEPEAARGRSQPSGIARSALPSAPGTGGARTPQPRMAPARCQIDGSMKRSG